jgi:hypothetical protein
MRETRALADLRWPVALFMHIAHLFGRDGRVDVIALGGLDARPLAFHFIHTPSTVTRVHPVSVEVQKSFERTSSMDLRA